MSLACDITRDSSECEIRIYDDKTKKSNSYFGYKNKASYEIIEELTTTYGNNIGIIVIKTPDLERDELRDFSENDFKKYGDLVHLATEKELDFDYYLIEKVEYFVDDLILEFHYRWAILYLCTEAAGRRVTWKQKDWREYGVRKCVDFDYIGRMFRLKINQVHVVFPYNQQAVNSLYGSELDKYSFKSVNFIARAHQNESIFARYLVSDPEVSVLVKIEDFDENNSKTYIIKDHNFIYIPKSVRKYEPRTDIMGIDLGSTRSVLAVSRNREIHVIPVDNSSPGDLWTESVVSFDEEKPIIGRAAVRRLRTKPDHVIFDAKLLYNQRHRRNISKQSILPFKFNLREEQLHLELMTCMGLKEFSLAEINKIFLDWIKETASEYQNKFNNGKSVTKAVITVPKYFGNYISSTIEAARLANIEVIDIMEETHADLLFYLSNERYSEVIKPEMKVAIFDIGGGSSICKIYKISEHEGKMYATCFKELDTDDDAYYSGRAIDDIVVEQLEKSIPEELRNNVKLRALEVGKKIKHDLSFEEKIQLELSEIHPHLEGIVEFTREWLDWKLETRFKYKKGYNVFKQYPFPPQRRNRCKREEEYGICYPPFNDVDIVFLAGGTCRIPFVQRWIKEQFPNAKPIIDGQLEIITATGAVLHALQILSREVEPYIKLIKHQSSETDFDSDSSRQLENEQINRSNDSFHLNEATVIKQGQYEVEFCNLFSSEKNYNLNGGFTVDKGTVTNRNQSNVINQSKINAEEIDVGNCKIDLQPHLGTISHIQIGEKENEDVSDCLNLNQEIVAKHDQITTFALKVDMTEEQKSHHKTTPEAPQDLYKDKKPLLP